MPRKITEAELRRLRNAIDIAQLIRHLDIAWKRDDYYFRFLCPVCHEFNTATNPRTNLGRCFRCRKNFNPIDIIMSVERVSFIEAVQMLRQLSTDLTSPNDPQIS